jgi:malonyl-CoA/methylmalonyl-CoA synthetase
MLFLPKFDAEEAIRVMSKVTTMMGVPTFYVRLLASSSLSREVTSHMRLFVCGSAPLLPETFKSFQERTGHAYV